VLRFSNLKFEIKCYTPHNSLSWNILRITFAKLEGVTEKQKKVKKNREALQLKLPHFESDGSTKSSLLLSNDRKKQKLEFWD